MTCHDARDLFSARIDEVLGHDETARLDAHLAGCADCRTEWARFERTVALVRGSEPAHAPAGFVDRVLEAARPVPWYRRVARGLFLPVGIKLPVEAAAILLVAGLAVMIFERSPEMQSPEMRSPEMRSPEMQESARHGDSRLLMFEKPPAADAPSVRPDERPVASSDVPRPDVLAKAPKLEREPDAAASRARESQGSKESATGPAAVESRLKRADETLADRAAREPPPPPASAPAEHGRRDEALQARSGREEPPREAPGQAKAAPPPASPSAARPAAQRTAAVVPPAVSARVVARDREGTLTAIRALIGRAGATELARRLEERADVVDVTVARDAYASFVRELGQLGTVTIERQPAELPATVTMSIRITD